MFPVEVGGELDNPVVSHLVRACEDCVVDIPRHLNGYVEMALYDRDHNGWVELLGDTGRPTKRL